MHWYQFVCLRDDVLCFGCSGKAGCQKKWALEVDFISGSIRSDCAEKSGVKACFDKKKKTASSDYKKLERSQ